MSPYAISAPSALHLDGVDAGCWLLGVRGVRGVRAVRVCVWCVRCACAFIVVGVCPFPRP
jgi:hypothetical protein